MKRVMKRLGIILCIFCLLWKTPQVVHASTQKELNKTASISVGYGLIPELKFGRYMTLHIDVKSHTAETLSGEVQVIAKKNNGGSILYQKEIEVLAGETARAEFYIPLVRNTPNLYIQVVDEDGKAYAEYDLKFPAQKFQTEIFTGVLNHRETVVNFLNGMAADAYSEAVFRAFPLLLEDMPENVLGLDMLDVILADRNDLKKLSAGQKEALDLWVADGGILVADNGDSFSEYSETFFEFTTADKGLKVNQLFQTESLVRYCEGNGNNSYATTLFSKILTEERINILENESYGNSEEYWKAYSLVSSIPAAEVPNLWKYGALIICYIVLAGPVLFIVLRKKGLQRLYRIGVVSLVIVFGTLIFVAGSKTRFRRPFINYGNIVCMNQDMVTEKMYFGLRSPNNNPYRAVLDAKYDVLPLNSELNTYYSNTSIFAPNGYYVSANDLVARPAENYELTLSKNDSETTILVEGEVAFTTNYFYGTHSRTNEGAQGLIGNVSLFEGRVSGTVTNETGYDLSMAVLMLDRQLVMLGEIKNGETKYLTGQKLYDFTADIYNLSQYLTGLRGDTALKVGQTGYMQAVQKMQLLRFYLEQTVKPSGGQDMLLAFPQKEAELCFADDAAVDTFGSTMIVSKAMTDRTKGSLVYRAFPEGTPEILEGYYNEYDNSLYENRHSVILYHLGEDMDIEKLCLRNGVTDADFSSDNRELFTGDIYFYNVLTGEYELQNPEKQEYNKWEIAQYLNDANELQVRYEADTINEGKNMALPNISVTGRALDAGN